MTRNEDKPDSPTVKRNEGTERRIMARSKKCGCAPACAKPATVRVGVGYGWMKTDDDDDAQNGRTVLADVFWQTIRKTFEPKHAVIERTGNHVEFSRLRASHGKIIWSSVLERIKKSDILIFDIAAAPEASAFDVKNATLNLDAIVREMSGKGNIFNANVLIEIGAAIALDKRVMLLCPEQLRSAIPNDLKGYLWTLYNWKGRGKDSKRCFLDQYGMQNGYMGMLRDVLAEKIEQTK